MLDAQPDLSVGYLPLSRPEANMVFQLVSRRYQRGSVICTSNKAFGEWGGRGPWSGRK